MKTLGHFVLTFCCKSMHIYKATKSLSQHNPTTNLQLQNNNTHIVIIIIIIIIIIFSFMANAVTLNFWLGNFDARNLS